MNFGSITRRIRRCENESAAQVVLEHAIATAITKAIDAEREACARIADLFEEKADALNDSIAEFDDPNEGRSEYVMGKATASSRIACAIRARGAA